MDIQMPDIDGLEAARRILAEADDDHPVAILMLTTFDLNEYVYDALRAGASGFLLKDVLPEQLIAAVRVVAAGDALIAPTITKRLIEQFARAAPPRTPPARLQDLTRASSRSSRSSPGDYQTQRSPASWSSARPPSKRTSSAS